jgi:hypothetical protein
MNPVTGEAQVDICGTAYTIRFDWAALGEISEAHGESPNLFSPEIVASVAASGMRRYHPEMTAARIMELSPPLVPFAESVQRALQWAYFGPEAVPESPQKKSPRVTGWWRRFALRAGTGSTPKPSGG